MSCRSSTVPRAGDHPGLGAIEAASAAFPGSCHRPHTRETCLMQASGSVRRAAVGPRPRPRLSMITKRYPRGLGPRRILNWL